MYNHFIIWLYNNLIANSQATKISKGTNYFRFLTLNNFLKKSNYVDQTCLDIYWRQAQTILSIIGGKSDDIITKGHIKILKKENYSKQLEIGSHASLKFYIAKSVLNILLSRRNATNKETRWMFQNRHNRNILTYC